MNIGNEIKRRRTELKLTQEELAKQLNVSRTAISNWEQQRNYPDIELLVTISDVLDISLDTLLRGDKKMVKEFSLDYKKKKRFKIIVSISTGITIGLLILCAFIWSHDVTLLSPDSLVIEQVDVVKVPATTVDGLPIKEDNKFKLRVKSKSLFTRLRSDDSHTGNTYQKKGKVYVSLTVDRSLNVFKNRKINQEGTVMEIPSFAYEGIIHDEPIAYNINKDIYLSGGNSDLDKAKLIIPKEENK